MFELLHGGKRSNEIQPINIMGLYHHRDLVGSLSAFIKEFLRESSLKIQLLGRGFAWLDTGTHDSLAEASTFVEVIEKRQGLKVACLEGIAYRNGWITEEKMREIATPMLKNQYGQYLLKVIDEMKEEINSNTFTHPEMSGINR